MFLHVVLVASATRTPTPATVPTPTPTLEATAGATPWVVVAAVVTGVVAIVVALIAGFVQARIARNTAARQAELAAAERREAREREDRAREDQRERDRVAREDQQQREQRKVAADVHEAISTEISLLSRAYGDLVQQHGSELDDPQLNVKRPPNLEFVRALNGLLVRLGELGLRDDFVAYFGSALAHTKLSDARRVMATMRDRLDHWFLGTRTTLETRRLLREDAVSMAAGNLPAGPTREPLPEE
jgi:hypothetical protein